MQTKRQKRDVVDTVVSLLLIITMTCLVLAFIIVYNIPFVFFH